MGVVYRKFLKRFFDTCVAVVLGIVLLVPLFFVAILVKLTSKGPIFFKQERFGFNSVPFILFKFRSMKVNTPQKANQGFNDIDSYLTPIGKFLRKTSLDELPQLINIIRGDMSFIGPRPLAITDIFVIEERKKTGADKVRPGITGLAQVNGRNMVLDSEKVMYDTIYANNLFFFGDMKILVLTVVHVFLGTGINYTKKDRDNEAK